MRRWGVACLAVLAAVLAIAAIAGAFTGSALTATPPSLSFDDQDAASGTGQTLSTTIANNTGSPIDVNSVLISGDATNFTLDSDGCSNLTLADGESCDISVTFDPQTTGDKSGSLDIAASDGVLSVPLDGRGTATSASISDTDLPFGDQDIDDGPTSDQTTTITNTGTEQIDLSDINITGPDASDFQRQTSAPSDCSDTQTLTEGQQCDVRVVFDPTTTGHKTATLVVSSNVPDLTADLTGRGTQTSMSADPDPLQFDPQDIDDTSGQGLLVTVTNTGSEDIHLGDASISDDADSAFSVNNTASPACDHTVTLQASDSCFVEVDFNPNTVGDKTATLNIPSTELTTKTVTLQGTGTQTELTPTPGDLHFGDQEIRDGATTEQVETITNSGDQPVTFTGIDVAGDSGQFPDGPVTGGCTDTTTLPAGGNCKLSYEFNPSTTGAKNATVTIHSNAPDISFDLDGTGINTELSRAPGDLAFGDRDIGAGASTEQVETITNSGDQSVTFTGIDKSGDTGEFPDGPVTGGCTDTTTLPAGGNCKLSYEFDPSSKGGKSVTVTIHSNAPDVSFDLTGTGLETKIEASPSSLSFGSQELDAGPTTQTTTVTNTGNQPVSVTGAPISGPQRSQFKRLTGNPDDCGANNPLAESDTCKVRVAFDPSWSGAKSATLTITSNAPDVIVPLDGTGTQSTFPRSDRPLQGGYVTDGAVNAVAFDSAGRSYIGGTFTQVGMRTGRGVKLSDSNDQPDPSFPDVDALINAVVPDGSGGWFIGGAFSHVGGVSRAGLAHIQSNGALDTSWNPGADGPVVSLARDGTDLYVGGAFAHVAGSARLNIAKLSTTTGAVDSAWHPDANNTVEALTVDGGAVYASGDFSVIGGVARLRMAKLATTDGTTDPTFQADANGPSTSLVVVGTDLYVGGGFTQIGGVTRHRVARLSTSTGVPDSWDPNANATVIGLAVSGSDVYISGTFTTVGGQPRNRVARVPTGSSTPDSWDPSANGTVFWIGVSGAGVYVAGDFTQVGGQQRNRLARLSTSTGLADGWNPNANGIPTIFAIDGSNLYVGGAFTSVGGQTARSKIARMLPDGTVDPDWNPGANNTVNALIVSSGDVFAGGQFTSVGGQTRNRLAKLSTADGAPLDPWNPNASNTVFSLALNGTDLYAGGSFTQVGGVTHTRLVKIPATGTGAPDGSWTPSASASVLALAADSNFVYAGGSFVALNGESPAAHFFIGRLDATTGAADGTWKPNADSTVNALVLSGGNLFVGGAFSSIGAQTRNRLAKLTTSGTGTADLNWDPNASGTVRALALTGTVIYAGGDFSTVTGQPHGRIVRLPQSSGGAADAGWDPAANGSVNALSASSARLAAGGSFTTVFGESHQGFALFDLPTLSRDPSALQFGSQDIDDGQTGTLTSVVSNNGTSSVSLSSVTDGGTDSGDFVRLTGDGSDCSDTTVLAPGGSCNVRARFDPSTVGVKSAFVTIAAPGTPDATVGLSGTGTQSGLSRSPGTLDFGKQDIDDGSSAVLTSTVTNPGTQTITLAATNSATISGGDAADFTRLDDDPADCRDGLTLAPSQTCKLRVQFDPGTTGSKSATLTLTSDSAPLTVLLAGFGSQTSFAVAPTSFGYGSREINNGPTATHDFTYTNTGTEDITLGALDSSGDAGEFTQSSPATPCSTSLVLHAGGTCTRRFAFDPTTIGAKSATFTQHSNSDDAAITLTGTGILTQLTAAPTSLDLGSKDIDDGATGSQSSTITNSGDQDVTITAVNVTGDFTRVAGAGQCAPSQTLTPTQSCSVTVTFDPTTTGTRTGSATVVSNAPDTVVGLTGVGTQTQLTPDTTALAFGPKDIDEGATGSQTATITNTGTEPVSLTGVDQAGDGDFTRSTGGSNCSSTTTLNANQSCTVTVTFNPSSTGAKSGSITLTSGGTVPDIVVTLSGEGIQTELSRSPDTLDFGGQDIDSGPSAEKSSTVTNSGTEPVTISSVAVGGLDAADFLRQTGDSTDCSSSTVLTAGQTCTVRVKFDPTVKGSKSASVTVSSNAADITISLLGVGKETKLSHSPPSMSFGSKDIDDGPTAPQTATITNIGSEDVTLDAVGIVGTDAGDFVRLTDQLSTDCAVGTTLTAGQACEVRIEFDPSTKHAKSATARVSANGVNQDVALSGTGIQTELTASKSSLSFGDKDIDDGATSAMTSVITNTGSQDVTLSGVNVSGDFAQATDGANDCAAAQVLHENDTCDLRVTFNPTATGHRTGNATVSSNAADVVVSLDGDGIQTELTRSPATVDFAKQDIDNGAKGPMSETITNSGTEPVTFTGIAKTDDSDGDFARVTDDPGDCSDTQTLASHGDSCTIRYTFDPGSVGSKSGTVTVSSNAADVTFALAGQGTQTQVTPAPTTLAFGDKDIDDNATAAQETTVTNTGTEDVTITSVDMPTDFNRLTGNADDCGSNNPLAANGTCKLRVTFDPSATGSRDGTATIHSNAPDATVSLTGNGIQTSATRSPASLSFGEKDMDDGPTAAQDITIENTGTQAVHITSASVSGDFNRLTGDAGDCTSTTALAAGQTCKVRVTFDPGSVGSKTGTATVTSSDVPDLTAALDGTGTQTELSRAPTTLAFGDRDIDDGPSSAQASTITNSGTQPVTFTSIDMPADFARVTGNSDDCAANTTLSAHGDTCKLRVTFDPSATGSRDGTATVHSNAANVSVSLTGRGTQTTASVAPTSQSFGSKDIDDGPTATSTSTITNTGSEPVSLSSVTLGGADAGQFQRLTDQGSDCTATTTLAHNGDTCEVRVRFDPSTTGDKTASVTVASNVPDLVVSLTGKGIQTELTGAPTSLSFGNKDIDDGPTAAQETTITNTGTQPVTFTAINKTGQFSPSAATTCADSTTLAAGQSCKVAVAFDPASTGHKIGSVTVKSNAADVTIALDGDGIQSELTPSPASLAFGKRDIDNGPAPGQTVTVTNTGTQTVHLSGVSQTGDSDFTRGTGGANDCGASTTLGAGQTCNVRVSFDPATTGSKAGSIKLSSGDLPADVTIALSGFGSQTELSGSTGTFDFGQQDIDDGALEHTVTVTNSGTEDVTLTSLNVSAPFGRTTGDGTDCISGKSLLHAGDTCELRFTFDPVTVGAKSNTAKLHSNAADVIVDLSGEGIQTQLSRAPASLSFGPKVVANGPTTAQDATITNTGTQDVTLTAVSVSPEFVKAAGTTCETGATHKLAAGAQCVAKIQFDPSSTGAKTGTLTVSSNSGDVTVSLDGTGVVSTLGAAPAGLSFGHQDIDDGATAAQDATITNTGTENVTISGVQLGGSDPSAFAVGPDSTCAAAKTLPPNATCTLHLSFDPAATGAKTAAVTVSADNVAPVSVNLSGTGTQTALAAAPSAFDFGTQEIDAGPGATQESTVTNVGTEPVTLTGVNLSGDSAFSQDGSSCAAGTTLNAGDTCTVRVSFDPDTTGAKSGAAIVGSNAAGVGISLAGTGIHTALGRSADAVIFANRNVAAGPSAAMALTFTNSGTEPIALSGVSVGGTDPSQFALAPQSGDCSASTSLGAGDSCTTHVRFDPSTTGPKAATLRLESSVGVDVVTPLTGTGLPAPRLKVASARASGRAITTRIAPVNGKIKKIVVQLRARSGKVLATKRVKSLTRARTVVLRTKKPLAPGTYSVTAKGRDAFGNAVKGKRKLIVAGAHPRSGGGGGSQGGSGGSQGGSG